MIYIMNSMVQISFYCRLRFLSVDSAQPGNGSTDNPAQGVEICQCPQQYSGLSCQVTTLDGSKY